MENKDFKFGLDNEYDRMSELRAKQEKEREKLAQDEALFHEIREVSRRKPFYEKYRVVVKGWLGTKNLVFLLHTIQALIVMCGLAGFFFDKTGYFWASYGAAFGILAGFEYVLHLLVKDISADLIRKDKVNRFVLLLTAIILGAIIVGDFYFAGDIQKPFLDKPQKVNELAINERYKSEAERIKQEGSEAEKKARQDAAEKEKKSTIMENGKPVILYVERKNVNKAYERISDVSQNTNNSLSSVEQNRNAEIERANRSYQEDVADYERKLKEGKQFGAGLTVFTNIILILLIGFNQYYFINSAKQLFGAEWDSLSPNPDGTDTNGSERGRNTNHTNEDVEKKPQIDEKVLPETIPQNNQKVKATIFPANKPAFEMEFGSQKEADEWKSHFHKEMLAEQEKQRYNAQNNVLADKKGLIVPFSISNEQIEKGANELSERIAKKQQLLNSYKSIARNGYKNRDKVNVDMHISRLESEIKDLQTELELYIKQTQLA